MRKKDRIATESMLIGAKVPVDLVKAVKIAAVQRQLKLKEVIEEALKLWLEKEGFGKILKEVKRGG